VSAFTHPNARRGEIADDAARLCNQYRLGARDVALHGTTDHHASPGNRSDHDRFAAE
jgi:hypothetical protein